MMQHLLQETYNATKRNTGLDVRSPQGFRQMLASPESFKYYAKNLAEGLPTDQADDFSQLAENTRLNLMENSMFQLNPYETMTLPILRVFYPKLVAKELVNVMPIDKPDVIKGFIRPSFKRHVDSGYDHAFPSTSTDISRGPSIGISVAATATEGQNHDVLAEVSLDSTDSHLEKDFKITGIYDQTGGYVAVDWQADVDGNFSFDVTTNAGPDTVSGHVDYLNGLLTWSSATGEVAEIGFQGYASLEENTINPTVKFDVEKIRFKVVDRRISAEWTVNMEQDIQALYDIKLQSELVNIIGEQIALDIDNQLISTLITANSSNNPSSHTDSFDLNPPTGFTWGRKAWYENIIPTLNKLSAQVYNTSLIGPANTLACNPLDAAVFESLNGFEYVGDSVAGGDVGYRSATVSSGKWKILVSSIVPQGTVIMKHRSPEMMKAVCVYAPYVPALLIPYPLGNNPSLTILSRYAVKVIRPEGLAALTITDSDTGA